MCNVMRCRSLVVLVVLLLLLTGWGDDAADRAHVTDARVGWSSFGTFAMPSALGASEPTRGASWLRGDLASAGGSSFGTCGRLWAASGWPFHERRRVASGAAQFVRHFLLVRGAGALRQPFDSS